jgi:hypothetical protein
MVITWPVSLARTTNVLVDWSCRRRNRQSRLAAENNSNAAELSFFKYEEVTTLGIVDFTSLARTIDIIDELIFEGRSLLKADRDEAAKWIARRQGQPGSYANMFAPTESDMVDGIKVFTGEVIRSKAATRHILGEESCRLLIMLNVTDSSVKESLNRATSGMLERLKRAETETGVCGFYCCGYCSVSYWRHLAVGGLDKNEERLKAGFKVLQSLRTGNGKWRRFPFYYTLLALNGIDLKLAREEMRYAAPAVESYLKRALQKDKYSQRRRILFEDILSEC